MGTSKLSLSAPITCIQGLPSPDAAPDLPPWDFSPFLDPLEPTQALGTPSSPGTELLWEGS